MISNINVENIQSLKKVDIDFPPGITVITGPSDVGKSATLRSIAWAADNEMSTGWEKFRRHGSKKSKITINDTVSRVRSATKNQYEVVGFKSPFKALGAGVPDEVRKILRLSSDNFQGQHQPYFLISDKPGPVAKTLNRVAELQIIDASLQQVRRHIREAKSTKTVKKEDLKKQEEKIENLQWVVEADKDYQKIESKQEAAATIKIVELQEKLESVELLQKEVDRIPRTLGDRKKIAAATENINVDLSLKGILETIENNQVRIPEVKGAIADCVQIQNKLEDDWEDLSEAMTIYDDRKALLSKLLAEIDDPTAIIEDLCTQQSRITPLEEAISEILIAEDCFEYAESSLAGKKRDYDERIKEIGVCPLCGSETCKEMV